MAKETLYNINVTSPVQVTRELYTNVGSGINIVGDVKRLILGSTDFEIWDSAVGGTQLTEGVDYQIEELDNLYSNNPDYGTTGISLYGGYSILNATYQTGNIYITYKIIGSYIDSDVWNTLYSQVATNTSDIITAKTQLSALEVNTSYENIVITNNSTNPNYQLDVSFTGCKNGPFYETSYSNTIDITTDLINGAEGASKWYDIVVFSGEGQPALVKFIENGVAFTNPVGYTHYRVIGNVYNNSSSNFLSFYQFDNIIGYPLGLVILTNGSATSATIINISTFIPPNITRKIHGRLGINAAGAIYVSSTSTEHARINISDSGAATETYVLPIFVSQSMYYFAAGSAVSNNNITIASYEINI